MAKYATSYNINNKMLTLVADIMEEVGKLSDPHSNHSLITGGVKIDLPDPYNEEGYASYFPKEKKIGDDAKRLLSWSKKQEKKVHPLILAAVLSYSLNVMTPLSEEEFGVSILYSQAILAAYRHAFAYIPLLATFEPKLNWTSICLKTLSNWSVIKYVFPFKEHSTNLHSKPNASATSFKLEQMLNLSRTSIQLPLE